MVDAPAAQRERRFVRLGEPVIDVYDPALVEPWDANAATRAAELRNHGDLAYQALIDIILNLLKRVRSGGLVLDAGCGLGFLSNAMAQAGYIVRGIDPSRASVDYAIKTFDVDKVSFSCQTIESLAGEPDLDLKAYDAVVANMVLHATPSLKAFLSSAMALLRPGGTFIATIPHPYFFLQTMDSLSPGDDHPADTPYWIEFRIRGGERHPLPVPYFHRTIAEYSEGLYIVGFEDVHINEPKQVGPGRRNDIIAIYATKPEESESFSE